MARISIEIDLDVGDEAHLDEAIADALRGIKEGWGREGKIIEYSGQRDCSVEHDWWEYHVRGEEKPI